MPLEDDAKHVAGLPLVPVRSLPDGGDGRHLWVVSGQASLDHHFVPLLQRDELVDDLQAVLQVVDAEEGA